MKKNLSFKIRSKIRRKKRPPLVSVIMPVYNAEKYLAKAIESILNQTYKRFELIIIDDMSDDKSNSIIKTYKRRHRTRIQLIETKKNLNGGGDMCANLGIEHARGKYIARMDADDIAAPDRFEKQVAFLEKNKRVFLVGSNAHVINKNGKIIGEKLEPTSPSDIYHAYATSNPIINSSVMVRRLYFGKHFSYQIEYETNNDYYTFFKLATKDYIFVNIQEKLLSLRAPDVSDLYLEIKEMFLNTFKVRFDMVFHSNYKFTIRDLGINMAQALILVLPQNMIEDLLSRARKSGLTDLLRPIIAPLSI